MHAIQAIAAAWVASAPGPRVRAAYESILDARHILHEITGRASDRLVLEEHDEVARAAGLLDGDALLRELAGAGRTVAYAVDHAFRQAERAAWPAAAAAQARTPPAGRRRGRAGRRGGAGPRGRPRLRSGPGPAGRGGRRRQAGLPLAPRALARLAECPPLPVPWPAEARDALVALLGAGRAAIGVWEALDQEGLVTGSSRTGSGSVTARSATRCTPIPSTGTWWRPRPTPPP